MDMPLMKLRAYKKIRRAAIRRGSLPQRGNHPRYLFTRLVVAIVVVCRLSREARCRVNRYIITRQIPSPPSQHFLRYNTLFWVTITIYYFFFSPLPSPPPLPIRSDDYQKSLYHFISLLLIVSKNSFIVWFFFLSTFHTCSTYCK